MGQGWSEAGGRRESPAAIACHPRQRTDPEQQQPPACCGGHSVCKIPEDEELNARTTEMQYADWKSGSGILKAKVTSGGLTAASAAVEEYQHFVDYSLFPDKFSTLSSRSSSGSLAADQENTSHAAMRTAASAFYRSRAASESAAAAPPPTGSLAEFSGCRPRSRSYSGRLPFFDFSMIPDKDPNFAENPRRRRLTEGDESRGSGGSIPDIVVTQDAASVVAAALTMAATPRTPAQRSSSIRFTFFDYSMIPDKDPRACAKGREK